MQVTLGRFQKTESPSLARMVPIMGPGRVAVVAVATSYAAVPRTYSAYVRHQRIRSMYLRPTEQLKPGLFRVDDL